MVNKSREKWLDEMNELVLGEQANEPFRMFNTSFSYDVLDSWFFLKDRILPRKSPAQKLDILMAYTYTIKVSEESLYSSNFFASVLMLETLFANISLAK